MEDLKSESKTEPEKSEESNEKPEEESQQKSEDEDVNKESKQNIESDPQEKIERKSESEEIELKSKKESKLEDLKLESKTEPENSEDSNEKPEEESKQKSLDEDVNKESKQNVESDPQEKFERKSESEKIELKSKKESKLGEDSNKEPENSEESNEKPEKESQQKSKDEDVNKESKQNVEREPQENKLQEKEADNSVNNETATQTDITFMGLPNGITIAQQTSVPCGLDLTDEEVVKILSVDYSHHSVLPESSKLSSFHFSDKSLSEDKIEERLNESNTPMEKNLLSIMSTAIRNLSNELLNLKSLYNKCILDEQFKDKKKEDAPEVEEDTTNRYEIDLCTVDALDFPLSVAKDDAFTNIEKFKVPARNIKDFDVNLYEEIEECQPMFDYDLDAYQEIDRNIFNANPNLFHKDKNTVFPMFDTSLKGGTIAPQIGLTRRKDITIFLEEYVQHIMTDADLLVKPSKEECPKRIKPLDSKAQWDTDIGKHTAQLNSDLMEKLYTCRCNKGGNKKDCSCGCQNPEDISESDTSDTEEDCNLLTMERAMFDFDLTGSLIKKPRRTKVSSITSTDTGTKPMLDTDLLEENEKYECKCSDIKDPYCKCRCQGKETILCEEVSTENVPMYDYDLSGNLIKKTDSYLNMDTIKKFKGARGMFDLDLKFIIDPKKTIVGKSCICHEALRPDCLCGCSPEDVVQTCTCVGESLPRPMWDVDLTFSKDIQLVDPNESVTFQEIKSIEDEEDDDFLYQEQLPVLIDLPWEDISFEPIPKSKKKKRKRLRPSNPIVKPVEGVICPTKPCTEIGCSDCKTKCNMECHVTKELPDTCQSAPKSDEVNIMYKTKFLKETESCKFSNKNSECENPCIIASSRIINQTSPGAVVRSCITLNNPSKETCHKFASNEPLSEISDGKILKTKIMYKISKPEIIEESNREKTIRTRIHIIRQEKSNSLSISTHATASQTDAPVRENITNALASYENEIRPLREALTSLQQKLKNLNLQDLTSSMSTMPLEPTLSTHFIMNVSQKDKAVQPSCISDFSEIVKETEYSNYSIKKCICCENTCEKQS